MRRSAARQMAEAMRHSEVARHWQKQGVVEHSGLLVVVLVLRQVRYLGSHCWRICLSHWDMVRPKNQLREANKPEVVRRLDSCCSSQSQGLGSSKAVEVVGSLAGDPASA